MTANTIESATTTDAATATAINTAIMNTTATDTRTAAQTSARLSAYIPTKFMTAAGIKTVQDIYFRTETAFKINKIVQNPVQHI